MDKIPNTWAEFFKAIQNKEYSINLHKFLDHEYANYVCYPPRRLLFNAFIRAIIVYNPIYRMHVTHFLRDGHTKAPAIREDCRG